MVFSGRYDYSGNNCEPVMHYNYGDTRDSTDTKVRFLHGVLISLLITLKNQDLLNFLLDNFLEYYAIKIVSAKNELELIDKSVQYLMKTISEKDRKLF